MAPVSPKTARLEIRVDQRGKFRAYYDGEPMRGVVAVDLNHQYGQLATTTVTFAGVATRLATEVTDEVEDGD
jgi:hypothetical protein